MKSKSLVKNNKGSMLNKLIVSLCSRSRVNSLSIWNTKFKHLFSIDLNFTSHTYKLTIIFLQNWILFQNDSSCCIWKAKELPITKCWGKELNNLFKIIIIQFAFLEFFDLQQYSIKFLNLLMLKSFKNGDRSSLTN